MDKATKKTLIVTGAVVLGFISIIAGMNSCGTRLAEIEKNEPVPESKPEIGLTFQKVGDIVSSRQVVHVDKRGCEYGAITHKIAGSGAGISYFNFVVCPNGDGLTETVIPGDGVSVPDSRKQTLTGVLPPPRQ